MQLCCATSPPNCYKWDWVFLDQPYVLSRKCCEAYKGILNHRKLKFWNMSVQNDIFRWRLKKYKIHKRPHQLQSEHWIPLQTLFVGAPQTTIKEPEYIFILKMLKIVKKEFIQRNQLIVPESTENCDLTTFPKNVFRRFGCNCIR